MFGPLLKGAHVTLRPGREEDADHFVRWFADTEVTRYLNRRMAVALYQEQEFLKKIGESKDDVWWMIDAQGKAIGATGIHLINWLDANAMTGIIIGEKDSWGRGFGTEATRLMLDHAFGTLGLHRVALTVFEFNERAIRAYRRCGFVVEGRARESIWREGRWWDELAMSVIASEWRGRGARVAPRALPKVPAEPVAG